MNKKQTVCWLPILTAFAVNLCAPAVVMAAPLRANWLEVRLLDKQAGQPIEGAAVCLGTRARADQFGAKRSDGDGIVRFDDVRSSPLLLTVSGQGYQGRQQLLEPMYESRVLTVTLVTGGGGPVCDAAQPASAVEVGGGLSLEAVTVSGDSQASNGAGVLVSTSAPAGVNQIRISERPDFTGADWQAYKPVVPFALSKGKGLKRLYVQVRRASQTEGATIEVVSPVKEVTYRLK